MYTGYVMRAADTSRRSPAQVAREVLSLYWDDRLPVDPGQIAKDMGVKLYARGGPDDPYAYSGYFRLVKGEPIIEYNATDILPRRRFTVAHELGHFVLSHEDAPRDKPESFGSLVSDVRERAANQFAAELLMPREWVRDIVLSGRMSSVQELADAFAVSKVAMAYRLANLELKLL